MVAATTNVGLRMPAYCTAAGRVMLASLSDEVLVEMFKSVKRERFTPHTKTRVDELMAEIVRVRANGYSISDEELELGLRSIAVPLVDSRGEVRLAIAVSLLSAHMSATDMVSEILPQLRASKLALEAML